MTMPPHQANPVHFESKSRVDSDGGIPAESTGKVQNTMSKHSVSNMTRNRNYMNSDVGTTIIENENGEE